MLNKNAILKLLGTASIALVVTGCAYGGEGQTNVPAAEAVVETVAGNAQLVSKGNFSGRSDHITTGQVSLEKTSAGYQLSFASDFELDGAPDPIVAIGNGETYDAANKLGSLTNRTGRQVYQLPANFKPGQFSEVYVWCEQFSVPLGVATLTTG